jgi:pimeloyl-ACP methyl ester carboxylesterase
MRNHDQHHGIHGSAAYASGIMASVPYAAPPPARTLVTDAGRTVGYYEFGDPDGVPVFALHGTPASGAGFVWADDAARGLGIRLIAPDRPGIGHSDEYRRGQGHVVADYVFDFEATADAFGIDSFGVLGYSGGGPYACAIAQALPERVNAAAIASCAGHVGEWASIRDFELTDRALTIASLRLPIVARSVLWWSARFASVLPRAALFVARIELPAPDRDVLARFGSPRAALALFTEGPVHGTAGMVTDYALIARPWGFRVEDIDIPLRCWHGTADNLVPYHHGVALAERASAELVSWEDEAHLAIVDHIREILEWLRRFATTERIERRTV